MDRKLPFGSAAWQPRWKRRRSERGPISLAVRALLELPDTIVEEILRLVNWRFLEYNNSSVTAPRVERLWAGTQRMVNRRRLITNYVSPSARSLAFPGDVTDLGFITFDAPRNVQNPLGFRVQGQGMMNVFPKFRSPF